MDAAAQILVEPGNPFEFDSEEFADLVDGVREDLGVEYDVRVAYREQVGAAVTLHEVVDFWLSWQSWSTAAQGVVLQALLGKAVEWRRRRREQDPAAPFRPFSARVIVAGAKAMIVAEVKIGSPSGEPEYQTFPADEEGGEEIEKAPPPIRSWPPREEDLPQRPRRELAQRRLMLEGVHAVIVEAQRHGHGIVVFDSAIIAGIGTPMGLNAVESNGLFRRLIEGGYLRLRDPLYHPQGSDELRAEVEYLTDRGLHEIGEL